MQEEVGTHGFKKFNYYSDSLQSCAVPVTLVQDCCVTKNPPDSKNLQLLMMDTRWQSRLKF